MIPLTVFFLIWMKFIIVADRDITALYVSCRQSSAGVCCGQVSGY